MTAVAICDCIEGQRLAIDGIIIRSRQSHDGDNVICCQGHVCDKCHGNRVSLSSCRGALTNSKVILCHNFEGVSAA